MDKKLEVVILAAGKGSRMKSDLPKVLHKLCGVPLLGHVLKSVGGLGNIKPYIVIGYQADKVKTQFKDADVNFVLQKEQLGTGHAVMQAEHMLEGSDSTVLVLNGDMPLITTDILQGLLDSHHKNRAVATVLSAVVDEPEGYGRIVRDPHGDIERIVEQKDGSLGELEIKEINTGTYCFDSKELFSALREVRSENSQHEYYLTDVIGILCWKRKKVGAFIAKDPECALGINTIEQLEALEKKLCKKK